MSMCCVGRPTLAANSQIYASSRFVKAYSSRLTHSKSTTIENAQPPRRLRQYSSVFVRFFFYCRLILYMMISLLASARDSSRNPTRLTWIEADSSALRESSLNRGSVIRLGGRIARAGRPPSPDCYRDTVGKPKKITYIFQYSV